jgi:hypothetical protein
MRRSIFSGLACALLLALLSGCSNPPVQQSVPRFEAGACPFMPGRGFVDGQNIRCGSLIVREDRAGSNRATIKLAVAILKTPSANPAPDPIIYLSSGPGESPLTDFAPPLHTGRADLLSGQS